MVNIHLCGLKTKLSTCSIPSIIHLYSSKTKAVPANAASTCTQSLKAEHISTISFNESIAVDPVVPIVTTTHKGFKPFLRSSDMACFNNSTFILYLPSIGTFTRFSFPKPAILTALSIEEWVSVEQYIR